MKILFATNFHYLPQRSGGSESSTHDLCTALLNKGVDVAVICSLRMSGWVWVKNRVLSKLKGVRFVEDSLMSYPVFRGYDVNKGIIEVVARVKADVVVVQAGSPYELVNLCSEHNIPVVYYARDVEFDRNNEDLKINNYVKAISNSNFTASKLKEKYNLDSTVLPPLINPVNYFVESFGNSVVHIGLSPEKGIDTSFELAIKRPDVPFVFVESWPLTDSQYLEYLNRAKKLPNVRLLRRSSDMKSIYRLAKILIVPSLCKEAWGRVVNEAQFSGIPVIASDRGGLPESVGCGGILVSDEAGIEGWEQALSRLWDDGAAYEEYSKLAFDRIKKSDISASSIVDKFITCLEDHVRSTSFL